MAKKTTTTKESVSESISTYVGPAGKKSGQSLVRRESVTKRFVSVPIGQSSGLALAPVSDLPSILKGLSFGILKQISGSTGFSVKEMLATIGMSERTYERRRAAGKLNTDESDRLVRVKRLYDMAFEIFNDKTATCDWFKRPRPVFGGMTPLEMAKTETGGREVEKLLGNLAYGVPY